MRVKYASCIGIQLDHRASARGDSASIPYYIADAAMRWVNDLRRHRLHEVISRQAYGDAVGFEARGDGALPLLYCTG